jgi:uncharacterized protein YPO0396
LPTFLKKYKELINLIIDEENAEETIGAIRRQVRQLQEETEEIKRLNQLLLPETFNRQKLNRHLLHYSQNSGVMPEEDWDEV